jgi:hypothetical protein
VQLRQTCCSTGRLVAAGDMHTATQQWSARADLLRKFMLLQLQRIQHIRLHTAAGTFADALAPCCAMHCWQELLCTFVGKMFALPLLSSATKPVARSYSGL